MSRSSSKTDASSFADLVLAEIEQGRPVQMELPGGGKLRLARKSPFLCVYRRSLAQEDNCVERLVSAEECHVIYPAEARSARHVGQIVRLLVEKFAQDFGTFLLIEMWSAASMEKALAGTDSNGNSASLEPRFAILAPGTRIPRATIEALSKALGKDVLPFGGIRTELKPLAHVAPSGLKPLVAMRELRDWNCYLLGLVVCRPFEKGSAQEADATVMRSIGHTVNCALDQTYFTFVRQRKSLRPAHYHAPERTSVVKAVLDIDRQLADIDRSFDLLLQATPVNAESAWREFRRSRFQKPPVFYYRPMPVDPMLLKRQLYLIPLERVEDPTLSYLFSQKQQELDRQITLLTDIDTPRFLPESLQIYGGVSDWLLQQAQEVLDEVPTRSGSGAHGQLNSMEFAKRAQQELGYYQQQCPDFAATVSVRDDFYAGMMVSGEQLLIGGRTRVARRRVEALLQHEIGTHLVTRHNGRHQPFQQLEVGLAGYDGLQEGLAVLAEYLVGGLSRQRMRILAARVVAAHHMLEGAPFIDTFRVLNRNLVFSQRTAYTIAMRTYRGGGLTKDAVYLRGLLQILRYLREGGDLEPLFVGKVASAHLPLIAELRARGVIQPPILRPRYLENPKALLRLERLRAGRKLLELLQG